METVEKKSAPAQEASAQDLGNVIAQRRAKVEAMRAAGKNLYGHRVDDLTSVAQIRAEFVPPAEGEEPPANPKIYRVAGRMMARRIMGKALFANVKDETGALQFYMQRDEVGVEAYQEFKQLDLGDIILVEGFAFVTRTG